MSELDHREAPAKEAEKERPGGGWVGGEPGECDSLKIKWAKGFSEEA